MIISYDGTDYHGWQRQPDKKTIQGILEAVLFKFRSKKIHVMGAGRTDAGVHALGQTAHFQADLNLNEKELLRALNGQLPPDIRVLSLENVDKNFHARKTAISKIYRYRIFNAPHISPFIIRYVLPWPSPLDFEKMQKTAQLFIRKDDFSAFSSNRLLYPVRDVTASHIDKEDNEITYTVAASGFLKYMVRTMVGTLLEIGKGKMEPAAIEDLFRKKRRSLSSPTAPAKGLCLIKVNYPD